MNKQRFITQCKIRRCFQCQGDTELYCNTCKIDLCLHCKNKHVIDLDTKGHELLIYREKFEFIPKQETCVRHPYRTYEMFCHQCKLLVCFKCTEHSYHHLQDIRTAYKTKIQQQRAIIHNVRSETLNKCCFLLAKFKTDRGTYHKKISNRQLVMSTKAKRIKNLIDTVIFDVKITYASYMMQKLQEQIRKLCKHLASIENYEFSSEQTANKHVRFLLFLKKTCFPQIKDDLNLTQHTLFSLTDEINMEYVIKLLSITKFIDTGKTQVKNEFLLSTAVFHKSITVTGLEYIDHISYVSSDRVWINDHWSSNLILTNTEGETLYQLTDIKQFGYGVHTVDITGDLIYIDIYGNINKLSSDQRTVSTLIKKSEEWQPRCVYCSRSNGDLLIGMYIYATKTATVTRHNKTRHYPIQHHKIGEKLYDLPNFIAENCNGDIIVSDSGSKAVVVTERDGRHRFSYTGHPLGSGFNPRGVCTNPLSHIMVCDDSTDAVQIIDKDGHFLSLIQIHQRGINRHGA